MRAGEKEKGCGLMLMAVVPRPVSAWEQGRLLAHAVEHGRYREGALHSCHFKGGIGAQRPECFGLGIPTAVESCSRRTPVRVSACGPPVPELLTPSFTISGSADANMGSPYCRLSMRLHDHLLLEDRYHLSSAADCSTARNILYPSIIEQSNESLSYRS